MVLSVPLRSSTGNYERLVERPQLRFTLLNTEVLFHLGRKNEGFIKEETNKLDWTRSCARSTWPYKSWVTGFPKVHL